LSALAGLKGIPFRITVKNACVYGVLDNHKKGAIVWVSNGGRPQKEEER